MSKYSNGLIGAGIDVENRMRANGIPDKFLSANLFEKKNNRYFWKNGDSVTEDRLDSIYKNIQNNENIYGDRARTDELFKQICDYRETC